MCSLVVAELSSRQTTASSVALSFLFISTHSLSSPEIPVTHHDIPRNTVKFTYFTTSHNVSLVHICDCSSNNLNSEFLDYSIYICFFHIS